MSDEEGPRDSPAIAYLKGHLGGLGGILGSDNRMYAALGAADADSDRAKRSAASVGGTGVADGGGLGILFVAYFLFLFFVYVFPIIIVIFFPISAALYIFTFTVSAPFISYITSYVISPPSYFLSNDLVHFLHSIENFLDAMYEFFTYYAPRPIAMKLENAFPYSGIYDTYQKFNNSGIVFSLILATVTSSAFIWKIEFSRNRNYLFFKIRHYWRVGVPTLIFFVFMFHSQPEFYYASAEAHEYSAMNEEFLAQIRNITCNTNQLRAWHDRPLKSEGGLTFGGACSLPITLEQEREITKYFLEKYPNTTQDDEGILGTGADLMPYVDSGVKYMGVHRKENSRYYIAGTDYFHADTLKEYTVARWLGIPSIAVYILGITLAVFLHVVFTLFSRRKATN